MSTIIACGCQYDGPDRTKCAAAVGGLGDCPCDCHAATHVVVTLNRSDVLAALYDALPPLVAVAPVADLLCKRWGIDR